MTAKHLLLCALVAVVLPGVCLFAQESDQETAQSDDSPFSLTIPSEAAAGDAADDSVPLVSTWDFVRMLLILAAVVGVIYLVFFVLKRTASKRVAENDLIAILGSKSLSGSKLLHLIEVGSSVYLIGSSESGVSLVSEITEKESLDRIRLQTSELTSAAERKTFREALYEMFKPQAGNLYTDDTLKFVREQKERVQKMRQ